MEFGNPVLGGIQGAPAAKIVNQHPGLIAQVTQLTEATHARQLLVGRGLALRHPS